MRPQQRLQSAMYTQQQVQPHLDEYKAVMGIETTKFVCPLTLRECELGEIIDGHICPDVLDYAYNQTVPVFGQADHWYGSRLEEPFIKFIKMGTISGLG